jgi:hypothetical protein
LVHIGEDSFGGDFDLAVGGGDFAGDEAEEGGFSGAIGSDDTEDSAARYGKGEVLKEGSVSEAEGEIFYLEGPIA